MDDQQFLHFINSIGVMKPAHIDEDNKGHITRLKTLLYDPTYVAEDKIDGCHYLCLGYRFVSTEGVEKTNNYPHLRNFFMKLHMPNLILDGEINYPDKTSQFCTRVTGCEHPEEAIAFQQDFAPIHYTIWDILRTPKGTWLINEPLKKRRAILEDFYKYCIANTPLSEYIHLTQFRLENKEQFYKELIASGKEGIVLKNLNSIYVMGKKPMWQWMKMKQQDETDLFISGYEGPAIEYTGNQIESWPYWREINGVSRPITKYAYNNWIGALELSAFVNGKATKICTCSGIDETLRADISANPKAYLGRVCKITYMEKTEAGYPRHPRFKMFHESKKAQECVWTLQ